MEWEGSCRNCCPGNSKGGNPLPGDAPLHKSTSSATTQQTPARKPNKALRSLHPPACICNTSLYLSSSFCCLNSGLWEGRPQQVSWTLPCDTGFALRVYTLGGGGRGSVLLWAPRDLIPPRSSYRWGFVSYAMSTTVSKKPLCGQEVLSIRLHISSLL